eukprot:COSAG01_NODE_5465_length_4244_cov_54.041255_3_plen_80_part_00
MTSRFDSPGEYFAELMHLVFGRIRRGPGAAAAPVPDATTSSQENGGPLRAQGTNQRIEPRLSIYGRQRSERAVPLHLFV